MMTMLIMMKMMMITLVMMRMMSLNAARSVVSNHFFPKPPLPMHFPAYLLVHHPMLINAMRRISDESNPPIRHCISK